MTDFMNITCRSFNIIRSVILPSRDILLDPYVDTVLQNAENGASKDPVIQFETKISHNFGYRLP